MPRIFTILISTIFLFSCNGQPITGTPISINSEKSLGSVDKTSEESIIYFSRDNGQTWISKSEGIPTGVFLTDIASSGDALGIATKQHGIFVYDFESDQWKPTKNNKPAPSDIDALLIKGNNLFAGSNGDGVFLSDDNGGHWKKINRGLDNLTIRKLVDINGKVYAGTNGGLFSFDESANIWTKEYTSNILQVNGIACLDDEIYIGTNRGAFKSSVNKNNWQLILPERSLHNISVANNNVYAMVYNELFVSSDRGATWNSDQKGMPDGKYSFQVIQSGDNVLDGQWDGIYRKDIALNWFKSDNGLPKNIPVTEMKMFKNVLIAASSQWHMEN